MKALEAIELVKKVCAIQHLSLKTQKTYCGWLKRYMWFIDRFGRDFDSSERRVEAFLSDLARSGVAATTQNQAFNAVLFFYSNVLKQRLKDVNALRAKRPSTIRYAPPQEEVARLMREVQDMGGYPTRLLIHLIYGCGLRLGESVAIRVRDLDMMNSRMTVKHGKGGKDRVITIPCRLMDDIRRQLAAARVVWEHDARNGMPVKLPFLLAKKYPRSGLSWPWYWLTPLRTVSRDPRTGQMVRWHCLEQTVQRACRAAADRIGASGVITPHGLRHAFATHAMRMGANVRDVQVVMGHSHLDTTMGYLHAEAGRVVSPLEALA